MDTPRPWDRYLDGEEPAVLARPRRRRPWGSCPAVLSVDNYRAALGDERLPLAESVQTWPLSTGLAGWDALERISVLFKAARAVDVPIIHVTGLDERESGVQGWAAFASGQAPLQPGQAAGHPRRYDIVDQAAPEPGEVVLRKTAPSAFFGTPLVAHLIANRIDTLIVSGETASGCVRATVVDGASYRFTMVVVEDCVYDRVEASRAINLFDIDSKYGDVVSLDVMLAWLRTRTQPA